MKRSFLIPTLLVSFLLMVSIAKAQPEPVDFKPVDNYVLKTDVRLAAGFNCVVLANAAQFNKMFVSPKGATAVTPNFTTQRVIAIATPPTYRKTTIIIDKIEMSGSILYVHFREVLAENLTTAVAAYEVVSFDRASFIKTIAFYKDKHLVKSIPVK